MLAFPIWSVISGRAKFPLLIADTFQQAALHISNLKNELESNELLKTDWGIFSGGDEWQATNLVIPKYGARIIAKSTGQKIRGIRHKEFRPDLCVNDDLENLEDVRTKEQRDKTYFWFLGDVLPAMGDEAKIILVGNLLHSDSLLMRIKKQIEDGSRSGKVLEFPFLDKEGKPLWIEKFPNEQAVEKEKTKINDNRTWQREYFLKIIPSEGQEIQDDWIKSYDRLPPEEAVIYQGTGIDLAISKKATADYTAMVSGKLAKIDGEIKIFIMPNPTNERLSLHETIEKAKSVSLALGEGNLTPLWVEDVAYQKAAIQELVREGLPAEGIKVSMDKLSRLRTVAIYIQNGTVLFPKRGCEDLLIQLTGFGVEAYDDLSDGFILLVQSLMSQTFGEPRITIFSGNDDNNDLSDENKSEAKRFGHSQKWYQDMNQEEPKIKNEIII